jgi:hypothetical protein
LLGKIGVLPPQIPRQSDPQFHGIPKKLRKKNLEAEYARINSEFPARTPARAAASSAAEKRRIARYKKAQKEIDRKKKGGVLDPIIEDEDDE